MCGMGLDGEPYSLHADHLHRAELDLHPAGRDYYSFDHGPIHFVQFSTEVNFEPGSDQYAFVTADLAAVDRSKTPWIVAGFHRPYITPTVRLASASGPPGKRCWWLFHRIAVLRNAAHEDHEIVFASWNLLMATLTEWCGGLYRVLSS